jgi:hypothetical protein
MTLLEMSPLGWGPFSGASCLLLRVVIPPETLMWKIAGLSRVLPSSNRLDRRSSRPCRSSDCALYSDRPGGVRIPRRSAGADLETACLD